MTERVYQVTVRVYKKGYTYVMAGSKGKALVKAIQRGATGILYEDIPEDTVEIVDVQPYKEDENVKMD